MIFVWNLGIDFQSRGPTPEQVAQLSRYEAADSLHLHVVYTLLLVQHHIPIGYYLRSN